MDRRYGDETDFFDCVAFGKTAELIDKWLSKGREVVVWGEGQTNSYTDKNGIKRKSYSIFVNGFDFCGSKSDSRAQVVDSFEEAERDVPF